MNHPAFPKDFLWGAATASFQVEGSLEADGAGSSNWLEFCRRPGTVANDDIPLRGASQYTCYKEDVQLLKSLASRRTAFRSAGGGSSRRGPVVSIRKGWITTTG